MQQLDLLVLGAGWTWTFLHPALISASLRYAASTTTGRDGTLKFAFDPSLSADEQKAVFASLPSARFVLVTFPLANADATKVLIESYNATHRGEAKFIALGSTGAWTPGAQYVQGFKYTTRHDPVAADNARAKAEVPFLEAGGVVLHLAGLWGGARDPRNWIERVAKTKEDVKGKGSLHMVHGEDVARAVVGVVQGWEKAEGGQRWMVTDGWVYDWWSLMVRWKTEGRLTKQGRWAMELVAEQGGTLPRGVEKLGRALDAGEFWKTFGVVPEMGGLEL